MSLRVTADVTKDKIKGDITCLPIWHSVYQWIGSLINKLFRGDQAEKSYTSILCHLSLSIPTLMNEKFMISKSFCHNETYLGQYIKINVTKGENRCHDRWDEGSYNLSACMSVYVSVHWFLGPLVGKGWSKKKWPRLLFLTTHYVKTQLKWIICLFCDISFYWLSHW